MERVCCWGELKNKSIFVPFNFKCEKKVKLSLFILPRNHSVHQRVAQPAQHLTLSVLGCLIHKGKNATLKKMTVYNSHVLRSHRLRGLTGIKPTEEPHLVHKLPWTLEAPSWCKHEMTNADALGKWALVEHGLGVTTKRWNMRLDCVRSSHWKVELQSHSADGCERAKS